jgi:leucyl-tRNA---protein transferase
VTESTAEVRQSMVQVLHTLPESPPHPCAYLPGQVARDRGFAVHRMEAGSWQSMLESGWRRSGMTIYEPACPFCTSCRSLRLPVGDFVPDRSMHRIARVNRDLSIRIAPVTIDDERYDLYRRYLRQRHDGLMTGSRREFELFLGQSPVNTCEIEMRLGEKLVCVGTTDRTGSAWSCVYCYFDPDMPRRSLGTFNILKTIELCAQQCPAGREARLYLGYWVHGSKTMMYKSRFLPHEVLRQDGRWMRIDHFVPWNGPNIEFGPALQIHEGSVSRGASSS